MKKDNDFLGIGGQLSSGFKVPDDYFKQFEDKMLEKVTMQDASNTNTFPDRKYADYRWKIWTSIAIAASLVWAVFWYLKPNQGIINNSVQVAEFSIDEVVFYSIDEIDLAESFNIEDLELVELSKDDLSVDVIYEYLKNEELSDLLLAENL